MNIITGINPFSNDQQWVWVDHIVAITFGENGKNTQCHCVNGSIFTFTEPPEVVLKTIQNLLERSA